MALSNADNNTSPDKSQETNFDIVKKLIKSTFKLNITLIPLRLLLYQIDQEFGFIRNGKVKDGDVIGHLRRSKHLNISRRSEIRAVKELESLNIFIVDRKHLATNHYHINRDTSTWILHSDADDTSDIPDTIEYAFNQFQIKELSKYCDDLETEKLWLMSHGIPQDKAFGTLLKNVTK
jgi:hypothetical protein